MYTKADSQNKKSTNIKKSTAETLAELSGSMVKKTVTDIGKIGTGIFDQIVGNYGESGSSHERSYRSSQEQPAPQKKERNLFNYSMYHEKEVVQRNIQELTKQIKHIAKEIQHDNSELVKEATKLSIEQVSDKPGVYHERFLEVILNLLKALRSEVGKSRTWLQAMVSKKKKRGSLFAARTKEKGTQYSLSQELSNARSIQ